MSALDPAKIVALDIVSAEVRRNFRDYCARWATQPPFYIMHDGILQVMVGRHRDLTEVSMDRTIYSVELPKRPGVEKFDTFMGMDVLAQLEMGRASCRDIGSQFVLIWVVAESLTKI